MKIKYNIVNIVLTKNEKVNFMTLLFRTQSYLHVANVAFVTGFSLLIILLRTHFLIDYRLRDISVPGTWKVSSG